MHAVDLRHLRELGVHPCEGGVELGIQQRERDEEPHRHREHPARHERVEHQDDRHGGRRAQKAYDGRERLVHRLPQRGEHGEHRRRGERYQKAYQGAQQAHAHRAPKSLGRAEGEEALKHFSRHGQHERIAFDRRRRRPYGKYYAERKDGIEYVARDALKRGSGDRKFVFHANSVTLSHSTAVPPALGMTADRNARISALSASPSGSASIAQREMLGAGNAADL